MKLYCMNNMQYVILAITRNILIKERKKAEWSNTTKVYLFNQFRVGYCYIY